MPATYGNAPPSDCAPGLPLSHLSPPPRLSVGFQTPCTVGCALICRFLTLLAVFRPAELRRMTLCRRIVAGDWFFRSTCRVLLLTAPTACHSIKKRYMCVTGSSRRRRRRRRIRTNASHTKRRLRAKGRLSFNKLSALRCCHGNILMQADASSATKHPCEALNTALALVEARVAETHDTRLSGTGVSPAVRR